MFETTLSTNNIPILRVKGKIIGNTVEALRGEMEKQLERGQGHLLLDLTDVPLLDSSALGTIIAILQFLKPQGGKLVLLRPQKAVMNVFKVTRLDSILDIYHDEDAALNAFN
jgi:anti-sigma B factor antagonist